MTNFLILAYIFLLGFIIGMGTVIYIIYDCFKKNS